MRIPASPSFIVIPALRASLAVLLLAALIVPGCNTEDPNTHITGSQDLEGGPATLDVRGSAVDSEIRIGLRAKDEGSAGDGGTIRIVSTAGNVEVTSELEDIDVGNLISTIRLGFSGAGLNLVSNSMEIRAGAVYNFLYIGPGAELILTDSTNIRVLGDAVIEGVVRSRGDSGVIRRDGHDFSLVVGGTLVVTGNIICSGENQEDERDAIQPGDEDSVDPVTMGGNGGEIYISSNGSRDVLIGVNLYSLGALITGKILAEGGGSDSQDKEKSAAGIGGQILIGTLSSLYFSGQASARAGNSYTNNLQVGPQGGLIEFIADGSILMQNIRNMNLTGGRNSGIRAGHGGTLIIEAPIGDTGLNGFDVDAAGGRILLLKDGNAGIGGKVSFSGAILDISDMGISANGGDVVEEATGNGGQGGTVTLSCLSAMTVSSDVVIEAMGGDSLGSRKLSGDGGNFYGVVSQGLSTLDFDGFLNVRGGNNFGGVEANPGFACASYPNDSNSLVNIIGINDFPMGGCVEDVFPDFGAVVHSLDCSDGTIMPGSISTRLPAVLGYDFYRVYVGTVGSNPGETSSVTISTTGEADKNLDLFVGNAAAFLSLNPASYTYSSREATSTESITVGDSTTPTNLLTLSSGGFLSILVAEQTTMVEEYTITVDCSVN